jgi:hypothetical protein
MLILFVIVIFWVFIVHSKNFPLSIFKIVIFVSYIVSEFFDETKIY